MEPGLLCMGTWAVTKIYLCDQGFHLFLMDHKQVRRFLFSVCFVFKSDTVRNKGEPIKQTLGTTRDLGEKKRKIN